MNNKSIIPQHLAVKAFRDNGYKDAAHALAELIDNSVQAGESVPGITEVEVLCVDHVEFVQERRRRRVFEIGVIDNACGMNAEMLQRALQFGNGSRLEEENQDGIGRFGMGLPNASISQCRRLDVWTWVEGEVLHSYLDVDDIEQGKMVEVPDPKKAKIPKRWKDMARCKNSKSGTLVVWSELDLLRWRSAKALLENSESVVGRMYRYFISQKKARIRLASFEDSDGEPILQKEWDVRPNDPLYLIHSTCAPQPYDAEPAFDLYAEDSLEFKYRGRNRKVKLIFSCTKPKAREQGGHSDIGRHTARNQGISVVRANRELQLNRTFDNRSDTRERWWGVEIQFSPALDAVFGVTNNKQDAHGFYRMNLDEDAELEGLTPTEYRAHLEENQDPRLIIYTISGKIDKILYDIRKQIDRMREGTRTKDAPIAPPGSAEDIATKATTARRKKYGNKGESDIQESLPKNQKIDLITPEIQESEGITQDEAHKIAEKLVSQNVKFLFLEGPLPGSMMFDVQSNMGGPILIKLNSNHPARDHFFQLLKAENDLNADSPELRGLKLLFSAWARLEDEASTLQRKQQFEDLRLEWGIIARGFFDGIES
jgi:hypothetical protein